MSTWRAAWWTMSRAACTCMAMSASMNWMPWKAAIGLAELLPLLRVAHGASSAAWAMPTPIAPVIGRVMSSVCIAILNPLALVAEPLLDGHRTVREVQRHRREQRMPIFRSFLPTEKRHALLDEERRDALGALLRIDGREHREHVGVVAVRAPLLWSRSGRSGRPCGPAVVRRLAASEPELGSESEYAAMNSPARGAVDISSSVPWCRPADRDPAQRMRAEVRRRPGTRPAELFGDQRAQGSPWLVAELLRHPDAEQPGVDERAHRFLRVALGLVVLGGVWRDPLARHLAREVTDHRWSSVR